MRNLPRREQVAARLHRFASRIVLVEAQDDPIETEELAVMLTRFVCLKPLPSSSWPSSRSHTSQVWSVWRLRSP